VNPTLTTPASTTEFNTDDVQNTFLAHLPRIQKHAQYALRHVCCRETRDDLICEVLALTWKHFVSLVHRGKKPEQFIATLALRCSQAVRAGRRAAGSDRIRDVLSPTARARHGFGVVGLDEYVAAPGTDPSGPADEGVVAEALAVDPKARVPEQAALRIDFPEWRGRFAARERAILDSLAAGDRPGEVAERFQLSPARVSQLREAFRDSWWSFHRGQW
jgi:hypothetical protein